jgi:hypothetical protein
MRAKRCLFVSLIVGGAIWAATPASALAQEKSRKDKGPTLTASASIMLTKDMQTEIRSWYSLHPVGNVEALPPGIRKRLARGKPLPPGIAKQVAPAGLRSRVRLPDGYEIIEVGLDVLLVEVATSIVHDVLMDVVR